MTKAPSFWTVLSMMEWATDFFEDKGVKSPRLSIEWLLAHVLSIKRLDLYLEYDRPLSSEELALLKPMVKRRAVHEPLQYITGETDFHHVKIKVRPGVLIPRQETEQLVDWVLEEYDETTQLTVLDVGTGSGCIPVALKKARPNWNLYATDISEEALTVAEENARYNEVTIELAQDDLFEPKAFTKNKFDLIISNPPYILYEEKNTLDDEVKNYEPELALFCESTHKMYQALEILCYNYLIQNGEAFFELHEDYAEEARQVFEGDKWTTSIKTDYSEKTRFLKAKKD